MSREQRRSRRRRQVRAKTISVKRMPKREIALGSVLYPLSETKASKRPRKRSECLPARTDPATGHIHACPFVSCHYHLYLDVNRRSGAIKVNFPDLEPDQLTHSCALDVADRRGQTLEQVGAILNLTRERVRQIEVIAMAQIFESGESVILEEYVEKDLRPVRRLPVIQDADDFDDSDELEDSDV